MTDDIVTRLRKALQYEDGYQMTIAPEAVAAIANEIERLRVAIRHLYFNDGVCYGENCEHCQTVYGLVNDGAVRGE